MQMIIAINRLQSRMPNKRMRQGPAIYPPRPWHTQQSSKTSCNIVLVNEVPLQICIIENFPVLPNLIYPYSRTSHKILGVLSISIGISRALLFYIPGMKMRWCCTQHGDFMWTSSSFSNKIGHKNKTKNKKKEATLWWKPFWLYQSRSFLLQLEKIPRESPVPKRGDASKLCFLFTKTLNIHTRTPCGNTRVSDYFSRDFMCSHVLRSMVSVYGSS
jgi:hypothetical protein